MPEEPCIHLEIDESDQQRMMADLYAKGWGFHHIAVLANRPCEEVAELLMRNWPAVPERHPEPQQH